MDYMFPSRNNENLLHTSDKLTVRGNPNLSQEEDQPPFFLQFPSPFLDDMDTTTILPNLHNHHQTTTGTTRNKPLKPINTTTQPLPSKLKCVRKKRSAGKKDRHSKIHTAQGLRDRRMRLSVHTARKFFDLNDMLGFDKASKTIEWLFSKSQKAIDEVTETLQSDDAAQTVSIENNEIGSPLSTCETESVMEIETAADIDENLEFLCDQIEDEGSRKPKEIYPLVSELRGKARARDRMMIKNLEKPKQLFQADPSVDFHQSQLGFSEINPDDNCMEESSCYPLEFSHAYHFLKNLHLDNTVRSSDTYLENITDISSTNHFIFDYNKTIAEPPAGWLNSRNTFLGFLEGWDSQNSRMESNNGLVPNIAPMTGSLNRDNPTSGIISSNFIKFHSENQGQ